MARDLPTKGATLYCSFCGKSQHEIRKLIAGPSVFICDECVEISMEILLVERNQARDCGMRRARAQAAYETIGATPAPVKEAG